MYQLHDDRPEPANAGTKTGRSPKYPFRQMDVGDSFDVPYNAKKKRDARNKQRSILASGNRLRAKCDGDNDFKIATRTIHDEQVVRVWRIK